MNNNPALILPVVTIQPTFPEVIQEVQDGLIPSEKFWISCYKTSETSVHTHLNAELDDVDRNRVNLSPVRDVEVSKGSESNYSIACNMLGIPPTSLITPVQEYRDQDRSNSTRVHRITAFDIAPDSSRFATGFLDGSIFLYPTSSYQYPRTTLVAQSVNTTNSKTPSKPHLSSVSSLKFFPSSRVILSSGLDFSLTILPGELPEIPSQTGLKVTPVRTMRAHTRAVTDTAIVGVGRNIISSSLDSTVKLWDVSSGEVLSSLSAHSAIHCLSLGDRMPVPPDGEEFLPPTSSDAREMEEMSSKVVFCGLQNGTFEVFDLGFKKSIYRSPSSCSSGSNSRLSSLVYSQSHNLLATGSAFGVVTLYDTRSLGTPLTSFSRLETTIEDLSFMYYEGNKMELAIATSDGLPYIAGVVPEGPIVKAELVGVDCDAVRSIRTRILQGRKEVWCAGDDGVVRRYSI